MNVTRDLEGPSWELRGRVFLAAALYFTLLPLVSFVSPQLSDWLGEPTGWVGPHTWGSSVAPWSAAAFLWFLYIARLSRRNVVLAVAIVISLGELSFILNRLNLITSPLAHASGAGMTGVGILAASFWFWHFHSRPLARR